MHTPTVKQMYKHAHVIIITVWEHLGGVKLTENLAAVSELQISHDSHGIYKIARSLSIFMRSNINIHFTIRVRLFYAVALPRARG